MADTLQSNMCALLGAMGSQSSVVFGVLSLACTAVVDDCCRNDWLVLPQNQRIIGGLTFQPRTLF